MFWRKQANSARIQGSAKVSSVHFFLYILLLRSQTCHFIAVLTSSSPGFLSVTNVCVVGWRLDPKADSREQDVNSEHWPMNQSNIKKPPNVTQRCQTHWKSVATCGVGDLAKTDRVMAIEKWSEVWSTMQYHPESVWLATNDNRPKYAPDVVKAYMEKHSDALSVIDWPPMKPVLNIIEAVWKSLISIQNLLWNVLQEDWKSISAA